MKVGNIYIAPIILIMLNLALISCNKFSSFLEMERDIQDQDDPERFFAGVPYTRSIDAFPSKAQVANPGWTGSYWPMRTGIISVRYGRNRKNTIGQVDPVTGQYLSYYIWRQSVHMYAQPQEHRIYSKQARFPKYVDLYYSPSEKYDLLMGDDDYTLTNYLKSETMKWNLGEDMVQWFGICHGWAPASYSFPRPRTSVILTNPDGVQIRFLPDDIKGLASLFYANAHFKTLFAGARCDYYYPHQGWFTHPNCISLNAGSFVIIIGNHVGMKRMNLVYEPNADPEIWNEPLKGYEFKYYNPITNKFFTTASGAAVSISAIRGSGNSYLTQIAAIAHPRTAYMVGIQMKITQTSFIQIHELIHANRTVPDGEDGFDYDAIIELDANYNILGGEWKTERHPNFIWMADEREFIGGIKDKEFPQFLGSPVDLRRATKLAKQSSRRGQPLKAVVQYLTNSAA